MLFKVQFHADTFCGFCYLGKRSLDIAIGLYKQAHPDAEFEVTWKSFILYPRLERGTPKDIAYGKTGASGQSPSPEAMFARLSEMSARLGARIGPDFLAKGRATTGPSLDSHRLLLLVRKQCGPDAQVSVADAIFQAYFEQGEDLSDRGMLARVAVVTAGHLGLGMSTEQVEKWLDSDEHALDVRAHVRDMPPIEAVPSVTVQGKYLVGGYQEPAVFVKLFERVGGQ